MKRILLLLTATLGFATAVPAQSSVGLNLGFSYTAEDITPLLNGGYTVNPFGLPVFIDYAWRLPLDLGATRGETRELALLGRAGMMHLISASLDNYDLNTAMYSFPLCVGCRYTAEAFFVDAVVGAHLWKVFNSGDDRSGAGDSGLGFCASLAPGYQWPLGKSFALSVRSELWFFQFPATDSADADTTVALNLLLGLAYRL